MIRSLRWFSFVLLCSLVNGTWLEGKEAENIKIITHNVWYGFTKKTTPRYEDWQAWMAAERPDIVSLQELNGYTPEKLADNAKAWGHAYSVLLKTDGFPTGITSRFPISDVKRIFTGMHHGLLRCRIRGIWFYVIHFHPSNHQRRIEEADILLEDIRSLPDPEPQIVLAGDFNGFSPSDRKVYDRDAVLVDFFQMLDKRDNAKNLNAGQIDYRGVEALLSASFVDVVDRERDNDDPFVGTFPTRLVSDEDHGSERRIDYIMVSPNLIAKVTDAQILRDTVTEQLSDHVPVTATIQIDASEIFAGPAVMLQEHGAGEGPAWHPQLGLLSSGEGNINLRNLQGITSVYRQNAGSNGLMFDRSNRLLVCEPVRRRVTRLDQDGVTQVLAETYSGMKFNQPNDLAIDSKNRIYFSDPCYGDRTGLEMKDEDGKIVEGVYRIDEDGSVTRIIAHEVDRPNGLVVTDDDQFLFVADNNNQEGGARKLWRFELQDDGSVDLGSRRLIYDWGTTRGPDGMKLDREGRLYVAGGLNAARIPHETADPATAGIYVFSTEGKFLEYLPIPRDETTNCGFGGDDFRTLFITAGGGLWSVPTITPGITVW
jgi:gluconolactonase